MSLLSTPPTNPGRLSTITPYQPGLSLELNITQSHIASLTEHTITAQVTSLITETMSPVMRVNLMTAQGPTEAILKLYDRRFGTHLREIRGKYVACCSDDEAAFERFVRHGAMGPFINEIEEDFRTRPIPSTAEDWREGPEAEARFESALWYEANQQYNETGAYTRLEDLQGIMIPRLYAQVQVASKDNNDPDCNDYMSVKGILLQVIPGCNLWDFAESSWSPQSQQEWTCIVQQAVDAAHEINKRDIILNDSGPRNVVVDKATHKPFIVDLAQCTFKNDIFQLWETEGFETDSDEEQEASGNERDPEVEWWRRIWSRENPASIGLLMTKRLLKTHGFKLEFQYPDYQQLLQAVKASAASPGVSWGAVKCGDVDSDDLAERRELIV
ncbi:hypothetical protein ACHAP5_011482 [Fusarium lateritium]